MDGSPALLVADCAPAPVLFPVLMQTAGTHFMDAALLEAATADAHVSSTPSAPGTSEPGQQQQQHQQEQKQQQEQQQQSAVSGPELHDLHKLLTTPWDIIVGEPQRPS